MIDHEGGRKDKYSLDETKGTGKVFLSQQCFGRVELRKQTSNGLAFGSAKQLTSGNLGRPLRPSFCWRQNRVDV